MTSTASIPVFKPLIEAEEIEATRKAVELAWFGSGSYVGKFEAKTKEFLEADDCHVVAVATGTAALHLALLVAGAGPGDEVIAPSLNFSGVFQAIKATGAEPVFCDIDDDTLCLSPQSVESLVSEKTKVIITLDYASVACDHEALTAIAEKHNLRIVHDAAHSFGWRYQGRMMGSFSDIAVFSFDPVKPLTCIDGGLVVVRSEEEAIWLNEARLVGQSWDKSTLYKNTRPKTRDIAHIGFRYHLSNVHAALGLAQLEKIERIGETRRATCRYYSSRFSEINSLRVPQTDFADTIPFIYTLRVPAETRDAFRDHLEARGVDWGIHWQPAHNFTFFKDARKSDLTITERVGTEIVTLPLFSAMPESDAERVADAVMSFYRS